MMCRSGNDEELGFSDRLVSQRTCSSGEGTQTGRFGRCRVGDDSCDGRKGSRADEEIGDLTKLWFGSGNASDGDPGFEFIEHCDVIGHMTSLVVHNVSGIDHRV